MIIVSCNSSKTSDASSSNTDKPIYVGIDVDFPPFGYLDNGKIAGFDYDIMNEVAKLSGLNVEFTHMQFNGLLPALQAKKIDVIIASMTVTEDRKQFVNFSEPYYVSSQVMLVHKDDDSIKTFDDLNGKNIGVVIGTTGDTIMTEKEGVNANKSASDAKKEDNEAVKDSKDADKENKNNTKNLNSLFNKKNTTVTVVFFIFLFLRLCIRCCKTHLFQS